MMPNNLDAFVIGRFIAPLKDRAAELPSPQGGGATLYLKCWGSDYPYLHGVEQQRRWLPVVVDSTTRRLI
jgi:hypothetical protein